MKYCTHCGKEIMDEAVICVNCGCAVNSVEQQPVYNSFQNTDLLLNTLSQRIKINGIIWLVIGCLQVVLGLYVFQYLTVVGILNIIFSFQDLAYSKTVLTKPAGIVKRFEPLVLPIIILVYNLFIGGVIGIVGSIYYFVAIRNYVMENRKTFEMFDQENSDIN